MSNEEIEAHELMQRGEIDQAIDIYQHVTTDSGRIFHLLGVLYAENKGDQCTAISYFEKALKIKEEVFI